MSTPTPPPYTHRPPPTPPSLLQLLLTVRRFQGDPPDRYGKASAAAQTKSLEKRSERAPEAPVRKAATDTRKHQQLGNRSAVWHPRWSHRFFFLRHSDSISTGLCSKKRPLNDRPHPGWPVCSQRLSPLTGPGQGITRRRSQRCPGLGRPRGPSRALFSKSLRLGIHTMPSHEGPTVALWARRQASPSRCCCVRGGVISTLRRLLHRGRRAQWWYSNSLIGYNRLVMLPLDNIYISYASVQHFTQQQPIICTALIYIEIKPALEIITVTVRSCDAAATM